MLVKTDYNAKISEIESKRTNDRDHDKYITENYCRLRLFSKFIQTQKRYPTSLDKIRILT